MISDYADTLENPQGLFKTFCEEFTLQRDSYGEIEMRSGNNACVFKLNTKSSPLMLKCYIKEVAFLREKYELLGNLGENLREFIPSYTFLEKELFVYENNLQGQWKDVLLGEWVEGNLLTNVLEWAARKGDADLLSALAKEFDRMAVALLSEDWAHADIKPDNLIVTPDGKIKMIDFDSMYAPQIKTTVSTHLGTPSFQHPLRDEHFYSRNLDDFSLLLISVSLRALACDPTLYARYHKGDNIFLDPEDIFSNNSLAYKELEDLCFENPSIRHRVDALRSPTPCVDNICCLFGVDHQIL